MKAAEFAGDGALRLAERPVPRVPDCWSLVRVRAAGVCGTELHFLEGLIDPMGTPRVLGHEIAGEVNGARAGSPGSRVAVYNVMNCGSCRYCNTNRDRLCENSKGMIGFTADGGFAEYVVVPEANLVPLPDTVSFEAGAVLACSGMTAVHAVRLAGIGAGDPVVVNGIGGVGLMVAQVAALAGATVLAVADDAAKLDLVQSLGAQAGLVIDDPEGILPLLASDLMPPVVTGLFLTAVLAAIMSTADSVLLLASSAVVRDFFEKLLGPRHRNPAAPGFSGFIARVTGDDARLARFGKAVTLALGVVGIGVALPEVRVIFFFVLFSWSGSLELVLWSHGRGALNQHLFKVTSNEFSRWFYWGWLHQHLDDFRGIAAGKATTMGHIQRHHLTDAKVAVPPTEILRAADGTLGSLLQQQVALAVQSRDFATLRDTLLPRLVSGQLRLKSKE